jgi:hypothetical protein
VSSAIEKIIQLPDRKGTLEEREAERKRLLAYNKTFRGRWRLFWRNFNDGRMYGRRSLWRVWGTDSQGQKHNLGMASTETAAEAIEECKGVSAHRNPMVLTYDISVTRLPQDKLPAERIANFISASMWFALRFVIFIVLAYAIDYTPLDIYRVIDFLNMGVVVNVFLGFCYLVILCGIADWVAGLLWPVGKRTRKNVRTLLSIIWIVVLGWLLNTHHYLFAGFVFLMPEWNWDGSFMTRERWFLAQGFCRMVWFGFLVAYLVQRWL